MAEVARLIRAWGEKEPGPMPTFAEPHLMLAVLVMGESRFTGRQALAKRIGLGEGAARTIIRRLKEEGFVGTNASGCYLTKKGAGAYHNLRKMIPHMMVLGRTELTVGKRQTAVLVRMRPTSITHGVEQRDATVRAGADGATTYLIRESKFQLPGDSQDCERDFPGTIWRTLREGLHPSNGDLVILCGSSDESTSTIGALSAILTLLR